LNRPFAEVDAAHLATTIHDFAHAALTGGAPEVDGREGMAAVAAKVRNSATDFFMLIISCPPGSFGAKVAAP